MKTKHVIVEYYNLQWKNEFERIKNELLTVLSEKINSIEHVGSTSVKYRGCTIFWHGHCII